MVVNRASIRSKCVSMVAINYINLLGGVDKITMNNDKKLFLGHFRSINSMKITTSFKEKYFLDNDNIRIVYGEKLLREFLEYYTPWHQKGGRINGAIEEVLDDPSYRTIKIKEAMNYLEKKDEIESKLPQLMSQISKLCPIPIATDSKMNKTLVLDGNKTIISLTRNQAFLKEKVIVVEIYGEGLEYLVVDFEVLSR